MCGRISQKSSAKQLGLGLITLVEPMPVPPRYNGAPGQEQGVIRQNPKTGERTLERILWGLIPHWCKDPAGGRKPINARAESVGSLPTFRRCLIPIHSFFEWKATKGITAKQPYAIAMRQGVPFALAGLWENWQRPGTQG
jgi:putative SOS response-associated peptidase YedK